MFDCHRLILYHNHIKGDSMNNLNEKNVWNFLKDTNKPIIIYGMGNGADKVLAIFQRYNIKCCGVMASDDFVRGQKYKNFTVHKLSYFEDIYDDFIIAVTFGTQVAEVMDNIKKIAQKHMVVVPNVPVFGNNLFNNNFLKENKDKILSAYSLLCDNRSRQVFENAVKFYYSGKLKYLWEATDEKDEIFNNVLKLTADENYIDLGAYRGDTIDELIHYGKGYNKIIALEPDPKTYRKLTEFTKNMKNVTTLQKTIWKNNTTLLFSNNGGRNSAISSVGTSIKAVNLDTLSEGFYPTYIKMDVEGAEKQAIAGGINTLRKHKPKLNVAVYHTFEDLFELILLIHAINPEYRFYLRHHPYIPLWDTNLYCI